MRCPIDPTHGDVEYNTHAGFVDGKRLTVFTFTCGHKAQPHPNRGEALDPSKVIPGQYYEGEKHPDWVEVVDPKDATIAAQAARIAELEENALKAAAKGK